MSLIIERFLSCDGNCGLNYGVDNRTRSSKQLRKDATKDGWWFIKGKDYCGNCRQRKNARSGYNRLSESIGYKP